MHVSASLAMYSQAADPKPVYTIHLRRFMIFIRVNCGSRPRDASAATGGPQVFNPVLGHKTISAIMKRMVEGTNDVLLIFSELIIMTESGAQSNTYN